MYMCFSTDSFKPIFQQRKLSPKYEILNYDTNKQTKTPWTSMVIIRVCLLKTNNDFSSLLAIVCFSFLLLFSWIA